MMRLITFCIFMISYVAIMPLSAAADDSGRPLPDDGSYKEVIVKSAQACNALCAAEPEICRGSISEQPDISKPLIYCRLNNGFGANPLFPPTPPQDLDLHIAVSELNAYRARYGLNSVTLNDKLNAASLIHAQDLAKHGTMSHTGSDGSSHGDRIQRQGYYFTIAAENVATGQKSWEEVFTAWKKSPGHNENLLREDVSEFGIALVYNPKTKYQTYWAMLVATPIPADQMKYFQK